MLAAHFSLGQRSATSHRSSSPVGGTSQRSPEKQPVDRMSERLCRRKRRFPVVENVAVDGKSVNFLMSFRDGEIDKESGTEIKIETGGGGGKGGRREVSSER